MWVDLLVAAQIKGQSRGRWLRFVFLTFPLVVELISRAAVANSSAETRTGVSRPRELRISVLLETLQVPNARFGLLRCRASWTGQLQGSWPLQHDTAIDYYDNRGTSLKIQATTQPLTQVWDNCSDYFSIRWLINCTYIIYCVYIFIYINCV